MWGRLLKEIDLLLEAEVCFKTAPPVAQRMCNQMFSFVKLLLYKCGSLVKGSMRGQSVNTKWLFCFFQSRHTTVILLNIHPGFQMTEYVWSTKKKQITNQPWCSSADFRAEWGFIISSNRCVQIRQSHSTLVFHISDGNFLQKASCPAHRCENKAGRCCPPQLWGDGSKEARQQSGLQPDQVGSAVRENPLTAPSSVCLGCRSST